MRISESPHRQNSGAEVGANPCKVKCKGMSIENRDSRTDGSYKTMFTICPIQGFLYYFALGFPSLTYNTSCHGRHVIASDNTKNHCKDSKMDRIWKTCTYARKTISDWRHCIRQKKVVSPSLLITRSVQGIPCIARVVRTTRKIKIYVYLYHRVEKKRRKLWQIKQ